MKRRRYLSVVGLGTVASFAGCTSSASAGNTFSLTMRRREGPGENVLDFDRVGLTSGQESIIEEAIETGSYVESDVTWDTVPGHEPVTMRFRSIIQRIGHHTESDPEFRPGATFETASRYGRDGYWTEASIE